MRQFSSMPTPSDTPRDTPAQRLLFAIEATVIAILTIAALVAPLVA